MALPWQTLLWRADPWMVRGHAGPGRVHIQDLRVELRADDLRSDRVTLCGLTLARCPGRPVLGGLHQVTCRRCSAVFDRQYQRGELGPTHLLPIAANVWLGESNH